MSNFYSDSRQWGGETQRLANMDAALAPVTTADLVAVLENRPKGTLLDIGAGTGMTVHDICDQFGFRYVPLDVNEGLLNERPEASVDKILAANTSIPRADGAFDVTFSRALTGWAKEPRESIQEQLRVTKDVAIFTEFDWAQSRSGDDMNPLHKELLESIKSRLISGLAMAGFNAYYGASLGEDVQAVLAESDFNAQQYATVHSFPEGDHRGLVVEASTSFVDKATEKFQEFGLELPDELKILRDDTQALKELPGELQFTIPALITHRVTLSRND